MSVRPIPLSERPVWLSYLDGTPMAKKTLLEELALLRARALEQMHRASTWDEVLKTRGRVDQLDELRRMIESPR